MKKPNESILAATAWVWDEMDKQGFDRKKRINFLYHLIKEVKAMRDDELAIERSEKKQPGYAKR